MIGKKKGDLIESYINGTRVGKKKYNDMTPVNRKADKVVISVKFNL